MVLLLLEELIRWDKHRRTGAWPRSRPGEQGSEAAEENSRRRGQGESELRLYH